MDRKAATVNPVALSSSTDLRRLGEQVQELYARNQFLRRYGLGRILHGQPTGTLVPVAQWGQLNRVGMPTGAHGLIALPKIRSDQIGHPLLIAQGNPFPVRVVAPSEGMTGRAPTINGLPEIRSTVPGLRTFISDGEDWFTTDERQVFDAAWFGMSPFASAATNTAALQAAVNAAHRAGGGVVEIPPGLYYLATIGGNVCISLTGLKNVWVRGAGAGITTLIQAASQDSNIFNITGATGVLTENITVSHMTIDGNRANNTAATHGIRTGGAAGTIAVLGLSVHHVEIRNTPGYGLGMQGGTKQRVHFDHFWIHDTGSDGIDFKNTTDNNESIFITNGVIQRWGLSGSVTEQAAIDARGPCQVANIWASEGPADGHYLRAREGGPTSGLNPSGLGGHKSHFSNCVCIGNDGATALGIYIAADDCSVDGVYVEAMLLGAVLQGARNSISNIVAADCADECFQSNADATGSKFDNCHAVNPAASGFRVRSPNTQTNNCTANGYVVGGLVTEGTATGFTSSNFIGVATGANAIGIDNNVAGASFFGGSLTNNQRGGSSSQPYTSFNHIHSYKNTDDGFILATGAHYSLIQGCRAISNGDDGITVRANGCSIADNVIHGNTQNGIAVESTADRTRIDGNHFLNNGAALDDAGTNTQIGKNNDGLAGLVAVSRNESVSSGNNTANIDTPLVQARTYQFRASAHGETTGGIRASIESLFQMWRSGSVSPTGLVAMTGIQYGTGLAFNASFNSNNFRLSVTNGMGADAKVSTRIFEELRFDTVEF